MSIQRRWSTGLAGWIGLGGCLWLACVNRGMHAPDDVDDAGFEHAHASDAVTDRAVARDGAADAAIDRGGSGGGSGGPGDAGADVRGAGGTIVGSGVGGSSGLGGRGAGGARGMGGAPGMGGRGMGGSGMGGAVVVVDAGPPDVPRVCSARFNFEGGNLHGAFINAGFQTGFSNLASGSDAACGTGALRMNVSVTPSAAKGEVIVPLGATEDLSGKTVTISVKAAPGPTMPNAYALVFLVPSYIKAGYFTPLPGAWTGSSVTLPSGADAGTRGTTGISIQVIGHGDTYSGVFSIDELDIR